MNRSQFNKAVVPGLFAFAVDSYRRKEEESIGKKLVGGKYRGSNRAYEDTAYFGGLGFPVVKPEGKEITYDDFVQGPQKRWMHVTYGLGTRITEEMIEDCLYGDIPTSMQSQSTELGSSFGELLEILIHDMINNGTSTTNHTAGDGLALFSASHTNLRGGTWSNILTPAADLSATSLQTAIDNFTTTKDDSGKYQIIKPKYIWIHPNNAWKAYELLESGYDPESGNNSINSIRKWGLQPVVSPYLTSRTAFTLYAEPPHADGGIIAFMRRKFSVKQDSDFETGDLKFKGTMRFSVECNKPNNLYHSAGA
jgi:hypothetical protein